jgi:hypothetical protein
VRGLFEDEERVYRELAERCNRLAREPAPARVLELPVYRMGGW